MSERETQRGDAETATCHVCQRRFPTQEALSEHLMQEHEDERLPLEPDGAEAPSY